MFLPLTGHFDHLLKTTRPPKERRDLAKELPTYVRDHLKDSDEIATEINEPVTRLAGSYGRKTSEDDIKDVDLLVFVDASYEDEPPATVLTHLATALDGLEVPGYGKGSIKTDRGGRRSHHVEFTDPLTGESEFHVDVVPVVRPGSDPDAVLRIPDREWTTWDDTQPLGYGQALSDLNARHYMNLVPLIRLMKRIKNEHMADERRPKSYWLEAAVFNAVRNGLDMSGSHADRIARLLETIRAQCGITPMPIYDPCLGHNLTENWPLGEYDRFVRMLDKVLAYVRSIDGETDEDLCMVTWRSVFGPAFADEEKARALASRAAALAAGIKIAPSGGVLPRTDPQPGMSSPSHRFWGDR